MKLNQLNEAVPENASFTRDKHGTIIVHRLKDGKVEPDVAAYKHKVAGIVIQDLGLTSLEGLPKIIKGNLLVANNKITSLVGGPEEVHGVFDISFNPVSSFEGMPSKLYELAAHSNGFTSLHNIHKYIKEFVPHGQKNFMISTAYTKHGGGFGDGGHLKMQDKKIKSHILGCLLIPGFNSVSFANNASGPFYEAMVMVNRRANGTPLTGPEIVQFQDQMIDAGLEEWAQL